MSKRSYYHPVAKHASMKYLYYITYVLKEIGLAGALFCAGFCLLLNLQFVSGVEVSGRLLVALGLCGLLSYGVYELARFVNLIIKDRLDGGAE